MPELIFEQSVWFVPVCLLLAAAISYLVYSGKSPWSRTTNALLMTARIILITLLLILLLNPLLNQVISEVERPSFVIAVDNSQSMIQGLDSTDLQALKSTVIQLQDQLLSSDYQVNIHTLGSSATTVSDIRFDQKTTDLDRWLRQLQSTYEGKNLAGVYLISDGKYNQGISPAYFPYPFKVLTLGIGDTVQKSDLAIQQVMYNKIAYQGNKFPVVAEVTNHGYKDQRAKVEIRRDGKVVSSQNVKFTHDEGLTSVEMQVEATAQGMQQLDISVSPLDNEAIAVNNYRRVFVDVVDGKQKILLVAPAPHPDIKALAAVIENNENYELTIFIPGMGDFKADKYDLVISHQAYSRYRKTNELVQQLREEGVPALLIFGNSSNILMASRSEDLLTISQRGAKRDLVFPSLNTEFSLFSLPEDARSGSNNYPPVSVPYGSISQPANAQILLYQRVGSIQTEKPLFYLAEQNGQKNAFLLAEGFWRWRMQEYAVTEATSSFDDMFLKTIQYLCTKVDKRKFKFYPSSTTYFENQTVKFQAEIYNQIYERIYGETVNVKIFNAKGFNREYSFTSNSNFSRLEASNFPPGLYSYEASVTLNGKQEIASGKFSIKELQLEELDQVADFNLLRQVAYNTGGVFYSDPNTMLADTDTFDLKGVIHSHEDIFPIVHIKWILALLLLLVTLEWFTRKYNGGY
ncbi:MAG: vWA domain-containing protein [Reichenbachiella sp.]|uniref:vWA domain-containing protein n=1 Tax=Reichenbachiella sp. TaxID=2184521 RepID=UPI003265DA7E